MEIREHSRTSGKDAGDNCKAEDREMCVFQSKARHFGHIESRQDQKWGCRRADPATLASPKEVSLFNLDRFQLPRCPGTRTRW